MSATDKTMRVTWREHWVSGREPVIQARRRLRVAKDRYENTDAPALDAKAYIAHMLDAQADIEKYGLEVAQLEQHFRREYEAAFEDLSKAGKLGR